VIALIWQTDQTGIRVAVGIVFVLKPLPAFEQVAVDVFNLPALAVRKLQRALVFVPRNLPCLIARVLVRCSLLQSSHPYLNQRLAKTTIWSREGSRVAQRRNRRAEIGGLARVGIIS